MAPNHATRLRHDEERCTRFNFGVTVCSDRFGASETHRVGDNALEVETRQVGQKPFCAADKTLTQVLADHD
ncbi:hypothetical protein CPT34_22900 [Rhizobium sophoriradicis]|uniref:Uncharacterized protein n=1 Tax=Rhizobium sophoriradicis TaxID=1535245 RepID=A0A2A5KNP5_9HYPH|nr:hypothetical protein CPT34_22900 [Rhizobium sophoriradicis]